MGSSLSASGRFEPLDGHTSSQRELIAAFLDQFRQKGALGKQATHAGAARHFLFWLGKWRIPLSKVNEAVVDRFARHRCNCGHRYRPSAVTNPTYVKSIHRFVRFLEDRGDIPIINDLVAVDSHLVAFARSIEPIGYSREHRRGFVSEAEHLACWMRLSRNRWSQMDASTVELFCRHHCHCPIKRKHSRLAERTGAAHRRRGARKFIEFLRGIAVIPDSPSMAYIERDPYLEAYEVWLRRHRGITDASIRRFQCEMKLFIVPGLGSDPRAYDAAKIRQLFLSNTAQSRRNSLQMSATVLRSYLRFLVARGDCSPDLLHAVPSVPRWRLATLPRYSSSEMIERIVSSCEGSTPVRIRDRAIILLLARLGLRAGEVNQLRLSDIDWAQAQLLVRGKGRRIFRLPLPQDVGDSLLAYIEGARPRVREQRIFLRSQAPFRPFNCSGEISGIVSRVLARAGIEGVPSGAHMFRHSLATTMLRSGGSLESVGAVLRHSSPATTAIYAKVDVPMLERVAQPWLGEAPC